MYYSNSRSILKIAISQGCETAKDLALFLKQYNSNMLKD
jgi:hypothetical protein